MLASEIRCYGNLVYVDDTRSLFLSVSPWISIILIFQAFDFSQCRSEMSIPTRSHAIVVVRFLLRCFRCVFRRKITNPSFRECPSVISRLPAFFLLIGFGLISASVNISCLFLLLLLLLLFTTRMSSSAGSGFVRFTVDGSGSGNRNGSLLAFPLSRGSYDEANDQEVNYVEKCMRDRYVRVNFIVPCPWRSWSQCCYCFWYWFDVLIFTIICLSSHEVLRLSFQIDLIRCLDIIMMICLPVFLKMLGILLQIFIMTSCSILV